MELSSVANKFRDLLKRPLGYELTEALFLRLLGLVYLAAFASFWPQMKGLFGSNGILPIAQVLPSIRSELELCWYTRIHQFESRGSRHCCPES